MGSEAKSQTKMNWQTTKPTIRERTKFMLNNDLFSDVKFVVRKSDCESESRQVIPAHKFVLSIGSPVFEAMFYGELAETRDSIELPDCEYESLLELFRYMYSDEVNLSGSNVMGVLYLAKKYMVPSLAENCTKYLQDHFDPSNVFSILPSAQKYEEENLVDRCWKLIDQQTNAAVKSDGFATIERSLLEAIVARDTLLIAEIDLFKAVELWATKECQRQGLAEADGKAKRRILGEQIVKGIRFPTMTQEDFASVVLDSGILMKKEIVQIMKYFNSVLTSSVGFSENKRCGSLFQSCCRFNSVVPRSFSGSSAESYQDCINFSVSRDILLRGVCIFGSRFYVTSANVEITKGSGENKLVSKTGQFSSELYKLELFGYHGFKVLFDAPIVVKKDTVYHLKAVITRPKMNIVCGDIGVRSVTCSGVTFTFTDCGAGDGTNVQIPELLFSL